VSWEAVNLAAPEFAKPSEPPAVAGLIYAGKRHKISGQPESLKTLIAFILGLEHSRGGLGKFAIVDFEMGENATRLLLDDLGASLDEIADVNYFNASGPPEAADLEALIDAGVTLAIIDSAAGAYDISDLDDNKRADVERFSRLWIAPLWLRGITTIVLDHVVKNSDSRGRYAIGSERKLGAVDVHLGFERVHVLSRGGTGLVRIATHKDRAGHLARPHAAELELRSDPETHRITWEFKPASSDERGESWKPSFLMERVLEYLSRNPEPISRSALANAVKGNRQYLFQAIDCLIDDGRLRLEDRKVVPVLRNVPGTFPVDERNGTFLVPSLQEERFSGTPFRADDIPIEGIS
jgi:hypothetical protein